MDGTVALRGDRGVFEFDKCAVDTRCETAYKLFKALDADYPIIFCTGRMEKHRKATERWLTYNGFASHIELFMRPTDDVRNDVEIKAFMYNEYIKPYWDIVACVDDRNKVVEGWRSLGLVCLQIRLGDF